MWPQEAAGLLATMFSKGGLPNKLKLKLKLKPHFTSSISSKDPSLADIFGDKEHGSQSRRGERLSGGSEPSTLVAEAEAEEVLESLLPVAGRAAASDGASDPAPSSPNRMSTSLENPLSPQLVLPAAAGWPSTPGTPGGPGPLAALPTGREETPEKLLPPQWSTAPPSPRRLSQLPYSSGVGLPLETLREVQ